MNILIDYVGHNDLEHSMHLLFEKRLGMKVFHPNGGLEWKNAGVYTGRMHATGVKNPSKIEETGGYTEVVPLTSDESDYKVYLPEYDSIYRGISFEQFKDMEFDIVLTTSHENEAPFYNLIKTYKPSSKFIRVMANVLEPPKIAKNILKATTLNMPANVNWIKYYPEHQGKFAYSIPNSLSCIKSFWNYMPINKGQLDWWNYAKDKMPSYTYKMHGILGHDGWVLPPDLPTSMQESSLIWHTKAGCCGYVARQALSCGKPLVVSLNSARIYKTLAVEYLKDGVNCIDLDLRPRDESIKMMIEWTSSKELFEQKAIAAAATVSADMFKSQACDIEKFIEAIQPGEYL